MGAKDVHDELVDEDHSATGDTSDRLCKLRTYAEVERLTGIPVGTLYSLVSRNEIPHVRLGRRIVRFSETDLRRWIEDHSVPAGSSSNRRST